MTTLTGSSGLTVNETGFDRAGFPVGQVAFEVNKQVTTSLFTGIKLKEAFVAP